VTIIAADSVTKSFAGIPALGRVSLEVGEGESVGLIGPNGAGKTTLFNVLLGVIRPDQGRVRIKGRDVTDATIHARARLGVARTFQRLELFGSTTPRDHLVTAIQAARRRGLVSDLVGRSRISPDEALAVGELLELVGLEEAADEPVESLSLGQARMVELARALVNHPDLLLLDEPSSGLDRAESARFAEILERVRAQSGTSILFVEHDLELVLRLVSRLYVMDAGVMLAEGLPHEVMRSDAVRTAYLGASGPVEEVPPPVPSPTSPSVPEAGRSQGQVARGTGAIGTPPLLELRGVDAGYGDFRALFGVDLAIRKGTAVALLGSNGAGKTTVARVCSGLLAPSRGSLLLDGVVVPDATPSSLAHQGILHVPEGRSVFASLTVEENLELSFRALEGKRAVRAALARAYDLFPRLGERRRQLAGTLSGGEQRMLSLARAFPHPPRLLIADELSLGLAPVIVDEVFETLATLRDTGTAFLIVEQHVGKALALADEVVVLGNGEVTHRGPTAQAAAAIEALLPGLDV
jgi:branched-chain amino acid transport system ATP-binding protein